jgi:amino acid adenylation domain-containing protein
MSISGSAAFTLSPQQQHIWRASAESGGPFDIDVLVQIEEEHSPRSVEAALARVAARHEILRTAFTLVDRSGIAGQVVLAQAPSSLRVDAPGNEPVRTADVRAAARRWQNALPAPQFGFGNGITAAYDLTWIGGKTILSARFCGLVADAGTAGAWLAALDAELAGAVVSEPVLQYADISAWADELLAGRQTRTLAAPNEPARRRNDDDPVAAADAERAMVVSLLDRASAAAGTDPLAVLAAVQLVLASRLGAPNDGRALEIEVELDGRRDLTLARSLGPLWRRARIAVHAERTMPFAVLAGVMEQRLGALELEPEKRDPLPAGAPEPARRISLWSGAVATPRLSLLSFSRRGGAGAGELFAHQTFAADRRTIDDLRGDLTHTGAERLATFLAAVADDPYARLADVPIVGARERARLLAHAGPGGEPPARSVQAAFLEQARRAPDTPAIVCGGEVVSYGQLVRRVLATAARIRDLQSSPLVPIVLPRGIDFIVAMLGVLCAGKAYCPIDADNPGPRVAALLDRTGAAAVVARGGDAWRLGGRRVIDVPREAGGGTESVAAVDPHELAYVIFTSGTSGEPKGVAIEHGQLGGYVRAVSERLSVRPGSGFALMTTLAADLGYTMLYPALCGGGTVHLLERETTLDAARLAGYFEQHAIDYAKAVPSLYAALVGRAPHRTAPRTAFPRKALVLGGEPLRPALVRALRESGAACAVFNHYGPTETAVGVLCGDAGDGSGDYVPLGTPLGGTRAYVLDDRAELAPFGVVGELAIGGTQVGRGYWNDPAATVSAFIADPLGAAPEARYYRTGDRVKRHADGGLEFLGRADRQVKIRGNRVELGEVEHVLRELAGVHEAIALAHEVEGSLELVAFCTVGAHGDVAPTEAGWRAALAERVANHLVPSRILLLERFPLSRNGKADIQALRALLDEAPGTLPSLGQDSLLETVRTVWSRVLGRPVGPDDDFFEHGGHSLLALRMMVDLHDELLVDVPLSALFQSPTARALARHIRAAAEVKPIPKRAERAG